MDTYGVHVSLFPIIQTIILFTFQLLFSFMPLVSKSSVRVSDVAWGISRLHRVKRSPCRANVDYSSR